MQLREWMNKNPAIVTGIAIGVVVLALVVIVMEFRSSKPTLPNQVYYSDDDGKTYFAADRTNVAPWSHDGKQAVRCHVFICNGTPFVAYLMTNTPQGKSEVEQTMAAFTNPQLIASVSDEGKGAMVKKPGDKNWLKVNDPKAGKFEQPGCGGTDFAIETFP